MQKNKVCPYVVCHMLTSLDGKIDGTYMSALACSSAVVAYGQIEKHIIAKQVFTEQ